MILSSPCQKNITGYAELESSLKTFLFTCFSKSSNKSLAWLSIKTLAIKAKTFQLKVSQKLLAVFLQYTFSLNELIRCTSQFFEWKTVSQCSIYVSKYILLHQTWRLLNICTPIILKKIGYYFFFEKSVYYFFITNTLLKCAAIYTLCLYTPILF